MTASLIPDSALQERLIATYAITVPIADAAINDGSITLDTANATVEKIANPRCSSPNSEISENSEYSEYSEHSEHSQLDAAAAACLDAARGRMVALPTGISASYARRLILRLGIDRLHIECKAEPQQWFVVPFLSPQVSKYDEGYCLSQLFNPLFGHVANYRDYRLQLLFLLHSNPQWRSSNPFIKGEIPFFSADMQQRVRQAVYAAFGAPDQQKKFSQSIACENISYWFDHDLPFLPRVFRITPEFVDISGIRRHLPKFDTARHQGYVLYEYRTFFSDFDYNIRRLGTITDYIVVDGNHIYFIPIEDGVSNYDFTIDPARLDECLFFIMRYFTSGLMNKCSLFPASASLRPLGILSMRRTRLLPFSPLKKTPHKKLPL